MLAIISPAKKLDFETETAVQAFTQPDFLPQSEILIKDAKKLSRQDLQNLMGISEKLADLNHQRFQDFKTPFDLSNAKQAALVFNGDTYVGLKAKEMTEDDLAYAQDHLRILSGLYGALRPLDLMQPYRLEMGIKFHNKEASDLYGFWNGKLAAALDEAVAGQDNEAIINLASNEYFKAVDRKALSSRVITPAFKEVKDGVAKTIGMFAKQARGAMARYMIVNRIEDPEGLKGFDTDGYVYRDDLSQADEWVFTRER